MILRQAQDERESAVEAGASTYERGKLGSGGRFGWTLGEVAH